MCFLVLNCEMKCNFVKNIVIFALYSWIWVIHKAKHPVTNWWKGAPLYEPLISVCRPLQALLNSIDVDEDTSAWLSPRLRLMLIVIGVVHCRAPNMLALASLWETARSRPSPRQLRKKHWGHLRNWGNIAGIQTHQDTSKCACSQSGWCEEGVKMCPLMFLVHLWYYFEVCRVSTPWAIG